MAASELIQDTDDPPTHLEVTVTTVDPASPPPPPRLHPVANGNLTSSLPLPPTRGDGGARRHGDHRSGSLEEKRSRLIGCLHSGLTRHRDYVKIAVPPEQAERLPREWWKTGVAFLYAIFNLLFTTVIITFVHERVPDKSVSPPLPDKFFDYVDRVPWAFTVTEVNGLLLVALWFIQWLFLKHKSIVGRRCFFLIGTLYMYRCVTMYITTLPVPGKHMVCAPKDVLIVVVVVISPGLSLTGSHLMCGDFLYSGHTVMLTLAYLFIAECESQRYRMVDTAAATARHH
ncbi:hypothetical protein CRUP_021218 [Coryphaenoides rupestris]|nr:hypothetical protein CRUP_021218 [Coryphaenoides rupestris]